ncbi:MAG: hypothetical protein L3J65_02580 [Robiginitomaculum sp.]|nr:hypothetical protein [Robiginitomaculum sp.]
MVTNEEKSRRMSIRKDMGNRPLSEHSKRATGAIPKIKGPDYLVAHACFECRKSYKYPINTDNHPVCPQCRIALCEMGRAFKAPKKSDVAQWKKVKKLWDAGYRFPTNTYEPVSYPLTLKEVDAFIKANPRHHCRLKSHWS